MLCVGYAAGSTSNRLCQPAFVTTPLSTTTGQLSRIPDVPPVPGRKRSLTSDALAPYSQPQRPTFIPLSSQNKHENRTNYEWDEVHHVVSPQHCSSLLKDRVVAFVTDFGLTDPYVGQMEASVVAGAPNARVISITNSVPSYDIGFGAILVAAALKNLPLGAVLVAVVDPGVGTERRGLIVRASSRWLVGPDNGLLMAAPDISGIWHLDRPEYWASDPHPTFHGRDVFAPVASHLARFIHPDSMGSRIDDPLPAAAELAISTSTGIEGHVAHIDRFGNLITNIPKALLAGIDRIVVQIADTLIVGVKPSYGTSSEPVAVISSLGLLEIALPSGSAEDLLNAHQFDQVNVRST